MIGLYWQVYILDIEFVFIALNDLISFYSRSGLLRHKVAVFVNMMFQCVYNHALMTLIVFCLGFPG